MGRLRVLAVLLIAAVCPVAGGDAASATPAPSAGVPVCGVAHAGVITAPAQPPPTGAVTVIARGFSASAVVGSSSALHVLDVNTRTVRRLGLDGAPLGSFSVSWGMGAASLAVDGSGNVYLSRWPATLVKLSPTGTELWARDQPVPVDGVYAIGSGADLRVGVVLRGVPGSTQFGVDGTRIGTSAITGTAFSPAPDGGLVATDGRYAYRFSASGSEQARFGDPRGTNDQQFTGGPYHFFQQGGAAVDAAGNFYVADATRGIHGATPEGYYRGVAGDAGLGHLTERSWLAPVGDRVYFAAGGRFNADQNLSWATFADLAALVAAPKAPDPVLGFGAGLVSPAVGQYFPAGVAPSVTATFDPWWERRAGGLSLRYTVRSRTQVVNQESVPATTITLPTTTSALASIPLSLPPARPGSYEVDARLVDSTGAVVGSTCYRYAVGAPGHRLDFSTLPPGTDFGGPAPARGVALADQLGVSALRATVEWARLLPSGWDGPMRFSDYDLPLAAAAREATARGVTLFVQVGSGLGMEQTLVNTGTWGARVEELVRHFQAAGVDIAGWEAWSEPNNNFGGTPQDFVDKVLAPFFQAVRAGDPDAKVIGGSVLGMDLHYFDALGRAGAYSKMDVVSVHPYTGHNRSWEEQGIPENIGDLRSILARHGAGGLPLWNTESAWWSDGPGNYFAQADKAARTTLWGRALGIERWSYLLLEAGYGDFGLSYSFIQAASQPDYVKPAALATMTADRLTGDRPYTGMLATGIPHAYAAGFGARVAGGDTVVAAWTDDLETTASAVVTSAAASVAVAVTDVTGDVATLTMVPGQPAPLALSGSPVYLTVPAGAQLRLEATSPFGANVAEVGAGASATASSATATNPPTMAIDALPSARLARTADTDPAEGGNLNGLPAWASGPDDDAPSLTVRLAEATQLDRVVVLTHSNGSIVPSLRDYAVEVEGDGGWATVAQVRDQFFERAVVIPFPSRQATAVRVTVTEANYGGYSGGSAPWFWPSDAASLADENAPWYGPAVVYELEAYGPAAAPGGDPPPAPSDLSAPGVSSDQINIKWSGSAGAASYKVERSTDNVTFAPIGTTTDVFWADVGLSSGTTYHYRVRATNEWGDSPPSNTASATTLGGSTATPPAAPEDLTATAVSSSRIDLTWTASTGAAGYTVERSTDATSFSPVVTGLATTAYSDAAGLAPSTTYHYRVRATSSAGASAPSNTASATTLVDLSPPPAPADLRASGATASQVTLSWTASPGAASYRVERSTDNVTFAMVASGLATTGYTDDGLTRQTTYQYRVVATNPAGDSPPSNTVQVRTKRR